MYFISILIAYSICRLIAVVLGNKLFSTGLFMLLVLLAQNTCKTTKILTACVIIDKLIQIACIDFSKTVCYRVKKAT